MSRGVGGGPEVQVGSASLVLYGQGYEVVVVTSEPLEPDGAPSLATVLLEVWGPGRQRSSTIELCCDEARTLGLALKEASCVGERSYPR